MIDFKNLNIVQETQINATLDEAKETRQRQKPITISLDKRYVLYNIWELDGIQIAKVRRRDNKEIMYHIFLDYMPVHQAAMTFDQALLMGLEAKYKTGPAFAIYAERMLNANFMPEYEGEDS